MRYSAHVSAALPDLNVLPAEALRALILAQHEQFLSSLYFFFFFFFFLISSLYHLQSRELEIEHLQLLLVKLHRMQFGRKSEKLQRQIEQLELRLEELQSHRREKEGTRTSSVSRHHFFDSLLSKTHATRSARSSSATNAPALAEGNGVSAMPGRSCAN